MSLDQNTIAETTCDDADSACAQGAHISHWETRKSSKKRGAPKGNKNSVRHGLRRDREALLIGGLGKGMAAARKAAGVLRELLEARIREKRGGLSIDDVARVNEVVTHEIRRLYCLRWLRLHDATLTQAERLEYLRELGNIAAARTKAINGLKLDSLAGDAIDPSDDPWLAMPPESQEATDGEIVPPSEEPTAV